MKRKNYKERYEELHDLFQELLSGHREVLERMGEMRAENDMLKDLLRKHGIEIPAKYIDF